MATTKKKKDVEYFSDRVQITFHISDVIKKCLLKIQDTNKVVTHLYHSVMNYNAEDIPPLQTDSFPFVITNADGSNEKATKETTCEWLFKKAFEEFITGISESLIEAYKAVKLSELSVKTKISRPSKAKVLESIRKIETGPLKLPFPQLIDEIEKGLNISLPMKMEILSINRVRNCLVHRNGKVSDNDINEKKTGVLKLNFISLVAFLDQGGEMTEITWKHKSQNAFTSKIGFQVQAKELQFKNGQNIILDANIINGITYTSVEFVNTLYSLIPKPQV